MAQQWADLSMASGNPPPQYYASAPLAAATLDGMRGFFHGDSRDPSATFLADWALCSPTAGFVGQFKLLDYLLYYPFVDLDDGDTQTLDNSVTLPRYTDGRGVMAMLVAAAPTVGAGQFSFTYINQDGNESTSPTQFCTTTSSAIASIVTAEQATVAGSGPFLKLASGDTGIRQILTFTNSVLNGGLGSLVLVKPLADHTVLEVSTTHEINFVRERVPMPRIYDGAYLNAIVRCSATIAAGQLTSRLTFVWG